MRLESKTLAYEDRRMSGLTKGKNFIKRAMSGGQA